MPASLLVEGTNVVAVEIHQATADSTDISFEMDFAGVPILSHQRRRPPPRLGNMGAAKDEMREETPQQSVYSIRVKAVLPSPSTHYE